MNGGERIEHRRLGLLQFGDRERRGAIGGIGMRFSNHGKRLLAAAPTVLYIRGIAPLKIRDISTSIPREQRSGIIEANVLYH
jgi:hypothetical protein